MSHDHSKSCSCSSSHYPDLLQKICPTRAWEVDSGPTTCPFEFPNPTANPLGHCCKCASTKRVKGKFGVAWICETPDCSCCEPYGWQVEFVDTPARVEQRCRELIEWVNNPPLPCDTDKRPCCCPETEEPSRCQCDAPTGCKGETPERDACSCGSKKSSKNGAIATPGDLIELTDGQKVSFHSRSALNQTFSNAAAPPPPHHQPSIEPPSIMSTPERPPRAGRASGSQCKSLISCNEKRLPQVVSGVGIALCNTNKRKKCKTEICRPGTTVCSSRRRTVDYCPNRHVMRRRRMVWLPAHVTGVLMKNLKAYLNSALHGPSCKCQNSVHYVKCPNKVVC